MNVLRLALAQINTTVGDFAGNLEKIVSSLERARQAGARVMLLPELALCGYPPEDLLLRPEFIEANRHHLGELAPHSQNLTAVVGLVDSAQGNVYNAAAVLHHGRLAGIYRKCLLPDRGVFDQERYFKPGRADSIFSLDDVLLGVSIGEDIWYPDGPVARQAAAGAVVLLNISASPYYVGRIAERENLLAARAVDCAAIVAHCNLVGGQDDLVFDGSSVVVSQRGQVIARARAFEPDFLVADVDLRSVSRQRLSLPHSHPIGRASHSPSEPLKTIGLEPPPQTTAPPLAGPSVAPILEPLEEVYAALVLGTRDYARKNGFSQVVIGLSGGIDSSLVACIAVDALGPENVVGVSNPSRYSSDHSKTDARQLAQNLGIRYETISIDAIFQSYLDELAPQFAGAPPDEAEENIQARIRGNILMALSNKFGWLVLINGNKSEVSVGYATLHGDMAGGFAVIKDVPKTLVYKLGHHRNRISPVIPQNVLDKPPSAELRPGQLDTDSLPPYDVLDDILKAYVEQDFSFDELLALGHPPETIRQVVRLVDRNEFKRRQAVPGVKITARAFGPERRMPITNRYSIVQRFSEQ
jgi:NAD+ synthase (glutamine-hydrolysing)